MYATAVTEVIRRKTFQKEFKLWHSLHVEKCSSLSEEESEIRAQFSAKFEKHFLRVLFHGKFSFLLRRRNLLQARFFLQNSYKKIFMLCSGLYSFFYTSVIYSIVQLRHIQIPSMQIVAEHKWKQHKAGCSNHQECKQQPTPFTCLCLTFDKSSTGLNRDPL